MTVAMSFAQYLYVGMAPLPDDRLWNKCLRSAIYSKDIVKVPHPEHPYRILSFTVSTFSENTKKCSLIFAKIGLLSGIHCLSWRPVIFINSIIRPIFSIHLGFVLPHLNGCSARNIHSFYKSLMF